MDKNLTYLQKLDIASLLYAHFQKKLDHPEIKTIQCGVNDLTETNAYTVKMFVDAISLVETEMEELKRDRYHK